MRIIGGEARGAKIPSARKGRVRPTPAIIREALFNILGPVEGSSWLDLYAGTGTVGLEALSRGATKVVFVEKNANLARQLSRYLNATGFKDRALVMEGESQATIRRLARMGSVFEFVFADPPYDSELVAKTVELCRQATIVTDGGLLILQHSRREGVDDSLLDPSWRVVKVRHYGDTCLTIIQYRKKEC